MDTPKDFDALLIAHNILRTQHGALEECAEQLTLANHELQLRNEENEVNKNKLALANAELMIAKIEQQTHIQALEDMMFIVSHKVRQPVANILGATHQIEGHGSYSAEERRKMIQVIIESAQALEGFTDELSQFIHERRKH